jgi:hypothetical protein
MGLMDTLKNALKGKSKQVESGIDKVADVVDDKTGGKHTEKIDDDADKAKDFVQKLDDENP